MIGVIGGVGFSRSEIFEGAEKRKIETPYGTVDMLLIENITFVPRHGIAANMPPHKIEHRANIYAFKTEGITRIIGMNSCGSMRVMIRPPSILIPHDYINLWDTTTFYDEKIVHIVPGLDAELRQKLISLAQKYGLESFEKGVYVQTRGPRLETQAEVSLLKEHGDVVGMTMASEATLAKELGLSYASICSVDNYAHGIVKDLLSHEAILKNAEVNGDKIANFLMKIAGELE